MRAGLSLVAYSFPLCIARLCGQMRGLAPTASVRLDLFGPYTSGALGVTVDCAGTWIMGSSAAVWSGVSVRCSTGLSSLHLAPLTDLKGSSMRLISGSIAAPLLVMLMIACNTVSPDECWINTSGGFGGSGPIPIGAGVGATSGDFVDPPRRPLDYGEAPNPCIMPSSPCDEKCLANYEVAGIACGKIKDEAQRTTCAEGAYAAYKSCHQACQQMISSCRDDCDQEAEKAWAKCRDLPKEKRRQCWVAANEAYAKCLKKCKD